MQISTVPAKEHPTFPRVICITTVRHHQIWKNMKAGQRPIKVSRRATNQKANKKSPKDTAPLGTGEMMEFVLGAWLPAPPEEQKVLCRRKEGTLRKIDRDPQEILMGSTYCKWRECELVNVLD